MAGNLKFYLITDLHYYDKSLGITGKAYEALSNADQKCLAESGAIIDAYFDKIVEDKEVDTVLIAGDVTYNGAKESHLGLLPKLNRFKEAGKRVFLITATHDYYVEGNRTGCPERCDGDVLGRATVTSREELAEMYYEFGPNEAISIHEESHSYSVQLCEGYRLLCLNDDGDRVFCGYSEDQLRWIDEQITAAHEAGDYIFAMTHHPVLPPTPIYPIMSKRDMLGDSEKTAEFLADRGVKFIFTGHAHMMNVGKITTKAGWYLTSSTAVYFFSDSLGKPEAQSTFGLIGTVGSVLGLLVIPVLSTKFTKRTTYTISLTTAIIGYVLMFITGTVLKQPLILSICYILASVGISSMFVSQTIFLADIVDYGEYKNGERNESITFSMKGFLQKMAYTIQTIMLFGGLWIMNYNSQKAHNDISEGTKFGIGIICFGLPVVFLTLSLIVFRNKFKIYGDLAQEVHDYIIKKRAEDK